MSAANRDAENAVLDYLQRTRGLDRAAASNLLNQGLFNNWFTGHDAARADPELKRLCVELKDTIGQGMQGSAQSRAAAPPSIIAQRNTLLRQLASILLPGGGAGEQARAVAVAWRDYFIGPWMNQYLEVEWRKTRMPPEGEPEATLWNVTRIYPSPLRERQLLPILSRAADA